MSALSKKERSTDRILVIQPKVGKKPKNGIGLVDPRLFTGENRLHAIMDSQYASWYLKYDQGVLPQAFKQKFTSFPVLLSTVKNYYNKRDLEITEVID